MSDPRCFAVMVQRAPRSMILQEDGLTFTEAFDAVHAYKRAKRPPHRVAFAIVVPATRRPGARARE